MEIGSARSLTPLYSVQHDASSEEINVRFAEEDDDSFPISICRSLKVKRLDRRRKNRTTARIGRANAPIGRVNEEENLIGIDETNRTSEFARVFLLLLSLRLGRPR